ncbi:hypothetical protein [Paenibacillus humicus]|uniref:hypothetical protein n=1 Tax=Paenibacillus humicus TaxID=412861 RepID=UPI003D2762C7
MMRRRRTSLILISMLGIICLWMLSRAFISNLTTNNSYDLQLGFTSNHELPKINDSSDRFINHAPLTAIAIYPDQKESLLQAQLYVTKRGESEILQQESMRETEDLAGFEMRLHNLEWEKGDYTLHFKRGLDIQKSLDFTLR